MVNQSLEKLKSLAKFLQISNIYNFQNWNLALFYNFINEDPELSTIINGLLQKYNDLENILKRRLPGENIETMQLRKQINSFEQWVVVCLAYIKTVGINKGDAVINNFIVPNYTTQTNSHSEINNKKTQFFNDCIEPILIYIELQIKHSLNALRILQRYKVLCEWYERTELFQKNELEITTNHLSKYLFDNGFTYSLSETNVPSGRLDNIAIDLGLKNIKEIGNLPDVIVAESKIFDGTPKDILDVKNQTFKRITDLNLFEGFCIIFNKTETRIKLLNQNGFVDGFSYMNSDDKKIYFIIINLNEIFFKSTSEIKNIEIKI